MFVAFRMPGTDSPDFAAAQILSDVLASQRAKLYDLVVQGKALGVEFSLGESYRKASVGFAIAAIPGGCRRASHCRGHAKCPRGRLHQRAAVDLVLASKQKEVASAEFERNSISDLAARWSDAVAVEGRESPDQDLAALSNVTPEDVNRVAKEFLVQQNAIVAVLSLLHPASLRPPRGSVAANRPPFRLRRRSLFRRGPSRS